MQRHPITKLDVKRLANNPKFPEDIMETKPTHSPTPWKFEPWKYRDERGTRLTIIGGNDAVASILPVWRPGDEGDMRQGLSEQANAAHIVRCVNERDMLIQTIQDLADDIMSNVNLSDLQAGPERVLRAAVANARNIVKLADAQ